MKFDATAAAVMRSNLRHFSSFPRKRESSAGEVAQVALDPRFCGGDEQPRIGL